MYTKKEFIKYEKIILQREEYNHPRRPPPNIPKVGFERLATNIKDILQSYTMEGFLSFWSDLSCHREVAERILASELCGEATQLKPSPYPLPEVEDKIHAPQAVNDLSSYRLKVLTTFKKAAFTLAEVLITLAIIGIVAALTIPTVIQNYQKKEIITKLKKAQSVLYQVITRSVYENGSMTKFLPKGEIVTIDKSKRYFNTFWIPYFNSPKVDGEGIFPTYGVSVPWKVLNGSALSTSVCTNYTAVRIYFTTKDGIGYFIYAMSWDINRDEEGNIISQTPILSSQPQIFIDINAGKGPNIIGKDIFLFIYNTEKNSLQPFGHTYSDNAVNNNCNLKATVNYSGYTCLEKIIRDNWQITYW